MSGMMAASWFTLPHPQSDRRTHNYNLVKFPISSQFGCLRRRRGACCGCICRSAALAGSPQFGSRENENPYEILGISPLDEFDQVKMAYKRRRNDVETRCNWVYLMKGHTGLAFFFSISWAIYHIYCLLFPVGKQVMDQYKMYPGAVVLLSVAIYAVFSNSETNSQYLIPGLDCDYSFIRSALHLSFVLLIAIGAGLEKTLLYK